MPHSISRNKESSAYANSFPFRKFKKNRKYRRSRCRIERKSQMRDGRFPAKEPWLIFISTNDFTPRKIMELYSRRIHIEQNFRNEKASALGSVCVPATVVQWEKCWF
ncbi:transposase [Salmonella enterica subsp. salamae]|nr:transposase [Salmonella enterica subsp. salamae]ECJ2281771.1 transposase [Salmonella enterica subsp. salamae]HCC0888752.1 transposase [Salmonella enterica]